MRVLTLLVAVVCNLAIAVSVYKMFSYVVLTENYAASWIPLLGLFGFVGCMRATMRLVRNETEEK